jgi:hypothetical protein
MMKPLVGFGDKYMYINRKMDKAFAKGGKVTQG